MSTNSKEVLDALHNVIDPKIAELKEATSGATHVQKADGRHSEVIEVLIDGYDEDRMRIVEDRTLRRATQYTTVISGGRIGHDVFRYPRWVPIIIPNPKSKSGVGVNRIYSESARKYSDPSVVPYLHSATLDVQRGALVRGQEASIDEFLHFFGTYTEAIEGILNGEPVAKSLGGLVLPECQIDELVLATTTQRIEDVFPNGYSD